MKTQIMETFILPITCSTETTEAVAPREVAQPDGKFAAVLANYFQEGGAEKPDPGQAAAENPASSMMAYFLSALMGFSPPTAPLEEKMNSPRDCEPVPGGAPSPAPSTSDPSAPVASLPTGLELPPLPPLFEVSTGERLPFPNSDEKFTTPQLLNPPEAGSNLPVFSGPAAPGEKDQRVAQAAKENLVSLEDGNPGRTKANPSPGETEIIPAVQEGMAPPRNFDAGPQQGGMNPPAVSSSPAEVHSGKSVTPPMNGEKIQGENNGESAPKKQSPAMTVESFAKTPDPKPLNLEPGKIEKEAKDAVPRSEIRAPAGTPGPTAHEGNPLPEPPNPGPVAFPKGSQAGFAEEGGKGQEKSQWMGSEPAPFSKKEIQNHLESYGASFEVRDASTPLAETGEVKENGSPAPPKTEAQTVSQQVSQRLIWSIRNNEEKVRISLDPPQLGHIVLEINRSKENVKTTLWTDNPVTKAALESGHLEIQRIVENEGFKLEKFNVLVQQEMGGWQGRRENALNPQPWDGARSSESQPSFLTSPAPLPSTPRALHPASRYLDLLI
jgi:hypothetical protein